jgi:hypothetical protein
MIQSKPIEINFKNYTLVDCSGGNLTPAGNRGKWETPQAEPRRLPSLPAESKFPQRKSTGYNQKQQSIRKQPF